MSGSTILESFHPRPVSLDTAESDALREPTSARLWFRVIDIVKRHTEELVASIGAATDDVARHETVAMLVNSWNYLNASFERALVHHPCSYKLWMAYIDAKVQQWSLIVSGVSSEIHLSKYSSALATPLQLHHAVSKLFQRALRTLSKMPMMWSRYLTHLFLIDCPVPVFLPSSPAASSEAPLLLLTAVDVYPFSYTKVRLTLLEALEALPVTQHHLVWKTFNRWCLGSTTVEVVNNAPDDMLEMMWGLYMLSNPSDRTSSDYIRLLKRRRAQGALLRFCCEQYFGGAEVLQQLVHAAPTYTEMVFALRNPPFAAIATPRHRKLFLEPALWDIVCDALVMPPRDGEQAIAIAKGDASKMPTRESQRQLGRDAERIQASLRLAAPLRIMLEASKPHCLRHDVLMRSFAVYLMRLGDFGSSRDLLTDVLETTSDPDAYQDALSALTSMESKLVEMICLDPLSERLDSEAIRGHIYKNVPQGKDTESWTPNVALQEIIKRHDLRLNAVQLRQRPHDVRLWLKRVELLLEQSERNGFSATHPETMQQLEDVFMQAFTLCRTTSLLSEGDEEAALMTSEDGSLQAAAAGTSLTGNLSPRLLFVTWATMLRAAKRPPSEIFGCLRRGSFQVVFASISENVALFGLLAEAICLLSDSKAAAAEQLINIVRSEIQKVEKWNAILHGDVTSASRGPRLLADQLFQGTARDGGRVPLLEASEMWTIVLDVILWAEGPRGPHTDTVCDWMSRVGMYSPAVVIRRSNALFRAGHAAEACRCVEDALERCPSGDDATRLVLGDSLAALFVSEATVVGSSTRMERLREILRPAIVAAKSVFMGSVDAMKLAGEGRDIVSAPQSALAFLNTAALCEEVAGFSTQSLNILRDAVRLTARGASVAQRVQARTLRDDDDGSEGIGSNDSLKLASAGAYDAFFRGALETFARKVLQWRGAVVFFVEMSELLQELSPTVPPHLITEMALRFTATLATFDEVDKCRAVFNKVSPCQDPNTPHGELFWKAWEKLERTKSSNADDSFREVKRLRRNVEASFRKSEVTFET